MPEDQESGATITRPAGFSKEDWLIIDEALNRVAKALRKIEKEEQAQQLKAAERHLPATH
jgi:hypothetical protein